MPDDKNNGSDEVGGVKDRLRDEFDEAAGSKNDEKDAKKNKSGKNPGGVKDAVKDEFDEASGGKKDEGKKNS